ncbi:hypothetical protein KKH23_00625 [Patescibacteria group bacterium]|nr:hypothetical protein [Patescibacteria group bacterium]MBU0777253.1 hypothetical protein [Patescibacteria group bacterium]MBU0845698.1 hypothetical protein [Patescibacteria group bacterium]MBU0923084.1 hypothetical protein [Patescibacteria group bacterium]MBU1066903.1 hypothetical protein [Patescibacteria group bacterium]
MKKLWISYRYYVPVVIYGIAWLWIFSASAQAGCSDNDPIAGLTGLCLARQIAGMSCYGIYFIVWAVIGWAVADGKGRNPLIGLIIGLALQFVGCIFMMMWKPRIGFRGEPMNWKQWNSLSTEYKKELRPKPDPITPEIKKRRKILSVISIVLFLILILQILKNLGQI